MHCTKHRMTFSTRNTQYWPGKEVVKVRQLANMAATLVPDNFILTRFLYFFYIDMREKIVDLNTDTQFWLVPKLSINI